MKTFRKKTKKNNLYKDYVQIINGVLQLSHRESEVFALLLKLDQEMSSFVTQTGNILSTDIRSIIMRETRVTKTNLMKYIYVYRDKGILIPNGTGKWLINPIFKPSFEGDINEVMFILDTDA